MSPRSTVSLVVVAFVVGALGGGLVGIAGAPEDKSDLVQELRRALTSGDETRRALDERVRSLQKDLQRLTEARAALADDPTRIGARGFEPLIGLEGVGRFFYRCAGDGMRLALVEDQMSATTEVVYTLPSSSPKRKTLHPGRRIVTPVLGGPSTWEIVQSTEPKTVTAQVEVGPPAGPCYIAPVTEATIATRSHD